MSDLFTFSDQTFIEQAEYLQPEDFLRWSTQHPNERDILKKLSLGGAKLITGPRGCGKTTLMLKAYHSMDSNRSVGSFPVYVNYKISLKLEPIYAEKPSATFWFKQWLIAKIYIGIYDTLIKWELTDSVVLIKPNSFFVKLSAQLELGMIPSDHADNIDVSDLAGDIDKILAITSCARCVLLLDDAAHAFSAQQQRDFFELFRQLKSRNVAPKAAIYPGVTYIPGFQSGHDAEEIDVWIDPYSEGYLEFMDTLILKRVPPAVYSIFSSRQDYYKLACYAAFGMPRALLNMVRGFYDVDSDNIASKNVRFAFKDLNEGIKLSYQNTLNVFDSLRTKLPIYKDFIKQGNEILNAVLLAIKDYNRGKSISLQSVSIAFNLESSPELQKLLGFYQYAGLMRFSNELKKGVKGNFKVFRVHIAALIDSNAIFGEKAINAERYVIALSTRNAHAFTRIGLSTLLGGKSPQSCLNLSLPPCAKCGTARPNQDARFCGACGQPFRNASIFDSISEQPISVLPLTSSRVATIKKNSTIRTIKDILMDHTGEELRKVPQVGPVWSKRIQSYAEEFIS
jgi:hypothetical protein